MCDNMVREAIMLDDLPKLQILAQHHSLPPDSIDLAIECNSVQILKWFWYGQFHDVYYLTNGIETKSKMLDILKIIGVKEYLST